MDFVVDGVEMNNPVAEMVALHHLVDDFEHAVENNLVMDFHEYVRRFGSYTFDVMPESEFDLECLPFVYVGNFFDYDTGSRVGWSENDIVACSCIMGHSDIISCYGDESGAWGMPKLNYHSCSEENDDTYFGEGWMYFCLEYHSKIDNDNEPIDLGKAVYLNRITGEYHWERFYCE